MYGRSSAGSGNVTSPNGDSAPVRSAASSLTAWSPSSRSRPAVVDVAVLLRFLVSHAPHCGRHDRRLARPGGWLRLVSNVRIPAPSHPCVPLGAWLADLPDERLVRLLELRPDLTQPPPGSIAALAARAQARQSVKAATDELDFLRLAVLDALLVLQADGAAGAAGQAGGADRRPRRRSRPERRRRRPARPARWSGATTRVRVTAEAAAGLPWYPGSGHPRRPTDADAERIAELLDGRRHRPARTARAAGRRAPRSGAPATPRRARQPTGRCSACSPPDCCARSTTDTVILPRLVGQVLRGELPGPLGSTAPDPVGHDHHRRRRRRRRGGCRHRPAARGRGGHRNPVRRTDSRTSQRRARGPRGQAADQGHRHRRAATRADPRGRGRPRG